MSVINCFESTLNLPFVMKAEPRKNTSLFPDCVYFLYKKITRPKIFSCYQEIYLEAFNGKREKNIKIANKLNLKPEYSVFPIVGMEEVKAIPIPYSEKKIDSVFKKLQLGRMAGIEFDNNCSLTEKVDDGLCSAIALTTLSYILSDPSRPMSESLIDVAKRFENGTPQKLAVLQAVFNTIHVNPLTVADGRHAKMQSLANAFDLLLEPKFSAIERDANFAENLDKQINQLSQGAYCLRMLWRQDNHKQENFGHSLVLVKERNDFYLLDSGCAAYPLGSEDIGVSLGRIFHSWGKFDEVRFYPASVTNIPEISAISEIAEASSTSDGGWDGVLT